MTLLLIICIVLALLFSIEIHIDGTYWIDIETDRPIVIVRYNRDEGVIYKYAGDSFERRMKLVDLLTKFKYNGT